jgi:hypothetical protein
VDEWNVYSATRFLLSLSGLCDHESDTYSVGGISFSAT